MRPVEDGVPAINLANIAADGRYRIDKTIIATRTPMVMNNFYALLEAAS